MKVIRLVSKGMMSRILDFMTAEMRERTPRNMVLKGKYRSNETNPTTSQITLSMDGHNEESYR